MAAEQERLHRARAAPRGPTARRCRSARTSCGRRRRGSRSRAPARRRAGAARPARRRTTKIAPWSCAQRANGARSAIVPSELETRFVATIFTVHSRAIASRPERSASPLSSIGSIRNSAPLRFAMYCHGTKFEWCSSSVTTTASPGPRLLPAPRVRDEVQRLGRVADEDDLADVGRVEECAHLLARALEAGGRALSEDVHGAVDVRVRRLVERRHRVEHLPRLLGAVRRVEVGERLSVDLLLEDREVRAQRARVELLARGHSHWFMVAP